MKVMHIIFDDKEHALITELKDELNKSWHDFVIELVKKYPRGKK